MKSYSYSERRACVDRLLKLAARLGLDVDYAIAESGSMYVFVGDEQTSIKVRIANHGCLYGADIDLSPETGLTMLDAAEYICCSFERDLPPQIKAALTRRRIREIADAKAYAAWHEKHTAKVKAHQATVKKVDELTALMGFDQLSGRPRKKKRRAARERLMQHGWDVAMAYTEWKEV